MTRDTDKGTGMGDDPVDHPSHYTDTHPGMECIDMTGTMPFPLGNAVKYVWRRTGKGHPVQDLRKAAWYLRRESSSGRPVLLSATQRDMASTLAAGATGGERRFWLALIDGDMEGMGAAVRMMLEETGEGTGMGDGDGGVGGRFWRTAPLNRLHRMMVTATLSDCRVTGWLDCSRMGVWAVMRVAGRDIPILHKRTRNLHPDVWGLEPADEGGR